MGLLLIYMVLNFSTFTWYETSPHTCTPTNDTRRCTMMAWLSSLTRVCTMMAWLSSLICILSQHHEATMTTMQLHVSIFLSPTFPPGMMRTPHSVNPSIAFDFSCLWDKLWQFDVIQIIIIIILIIIIIIIIKINFK